MKKTASLMLDVGGQSVMALVLDEQARPVAEARRILDTSERDDRVEQDPEEIVDALQAVVKEALAADAPAVTQAALAVQRGSIVCWDRETGKALSPVLSWRDRRSLPRLAHLSEQAEAIRQRTGLRFSPYAGAPKIAWCLSELPAVRTAAEQGRLVCGPLGSFLLARLVEGNPLRVDHTLAQRSLLWSRRRHDWDPWLLESFGLAVDLLPELSPGRYRYGKLRTGSAGFKPEVSLDLPLELMMGDQNCLPFIDGRPDPDTLYINLGTGAFLLRPLREPVDDARFQLSLLDERNGGLWALEGSVHGAASALNWLERAHAVKIAPEDRDDLRQVVDSPPLFLNRIDGLGSPWWQAGSESRFIGPADPAVQSPQALLLATLESIAFLIRANVDAMSERMPGPQRVVICGGLSRSKLLCRLIADLLQCGLQRLETVEGTALGLWCRLHDRALPPTRFQTVRFDTAPLLHQRYRRWLALIADESDRKN
ncbi:MAG: FGGY family carbohydrate kinase [Wenzhouxiangella sp.]